MQNSQMLIHAAATMRKKQDAYIQPLWAPSPVTTHGLVQRDLHDKKDRQKALGRPSLSALREVQSPQANNLDCSLLEMCDLALSPQRHSTDLARH